MRPAAEARGARASRQRAGRRETAPLDYAAWARGIYRAAARARRPITGSLALTYRCNLKCVHCYLRGCRRTRELPTERWLALIDELADAGCLWLLLTGGEPLLRPDFARVYLHAKRRGMLVTVFTNGLLVDDALIALWRAWPPHVVEVSLYGYSRAVYGAVTGVPEARDRCFDGVRRLARAGIPLRLKAMALRQNAHELGQLERLSARLGATFRYDPAVSPTLRGSTETCHARLDGDAILRLDTEDPRRAAAWADCARRRPRTPRRRTLFDCGAGQISFAIAPDGGLALCVYDLPVYDLARGSFAEGWRGPVKGRRETPLAPGHPCRGCRERVFCEVCPPLARMTTGSEVGVPQAACWLARRRCEVVTAGLRSPRHALGGEDGGPR